MKIVIAPDSFKGSLTATEVARTMREACLEAINDAEIEMIPMADGGEGTVEALVNATNGKWIVTNCTGPLGDEVETQYGILGNGTVVFEVANTSGLPMVPVEKRNPFKTTSYGLGQLIIEALDQGRRSMIIGLGGSATNDGGLGLLHALGVRFYDKAGEVVGYYGEDLLKVKSVSLEHLDRRIFECNITIASDVDNPLCGEKGASAVFGPQKGATKEQVKILDEALKIYANLIEDKIKQGFQHTPGAGAAGGLGFALLTLGGQIEAGAEVVAKAVSLEDKLKSADVLITGEGQSDEQTLHGKAPAYVAKLSEPYGVKKILISGALGNGYQSLYTLFDGCFSITRGPIDLERCIEQASDLLHSQTFNVARLLRK